MDTVNTSMKSGGLRIRLNVNTRVPTELTAFYSDMDSWFLKLKFKLKLMSADHYFCM